MPKSSKEAGVLPLLHMFKSKSPLAVTDSFRFGTQKPLNSNSLQSLYRQPTPNLPPHFTSESRSSRVSIVLVPLSTMQPLSRSRCNDSASAWKYHCLHGSS